VVALPLGALAGRSLWVWTARSLGVADDLGVPFVRLVIVAIVAFAGAGAIAALPGVLAARIRPAVALRYE
jgi:hypothetical protein